LTVRACIAGVDELSPAELVELGDPIATNAVAIARAANDAGVSLRALDAVLTYDSLVSPHVMQASKVCEYLGVMPSYASTIGAGGASPLFAIAVAAALVESGQARVVAVSHSDFRGGSESRSNVVEKMASVVGNPEFEAPLGPIVPTLYALLADWVLANTSVDRADLAAIAVQTRAWAQLNPTARFTEPLTEADVLDAPVIAGPLGRFDCCLVTDFGGAVIVCAQPSEPGRTVSIAGISGAVSHEELTQMPDDPLTSLRRTAYSLYVATRTRPSDIDAAFLYDSFTITVAAQLLAFGLDSGAGLKKLVREDGIGPGGSFPVNTHGGLLSASTSGIFHVVEAVRQLRGEAGARQVSDLSTALVTGIGGVLSHTCGAILTTEPRGD
jgi:acetyl-CoA acetyltransferase